MIAKMIEPGYVYVSTSKISGRTQTLYKLSESGKEYLGRLKEKWSIRFANMADLAPFDKYAGYSICEVIFKEALEYLDVTELKTDTENYLQEIHSNLNHEISMIENRLENLIVAKNELGIVIKSISNQSSFNREEIMKILEKVKEKQKINRREMDKNV